MEVYFDNSATTRCYDSVKDIVVKAMTEDFGNPSAMHLKGVEAEKYIKSSAESLARLLKVQEKEILFTSGGTESDNLALIGAAFANKRSGNHIITTSVEHPAVSQPALFLQEQGFEVTYLPVDSRGVVKMDALKAVLREDTILVSVMYVNNEVGAVMPVEEIAALVHEKSPKALFHVDAIQAFGKYRIYPKKMGIDLLSVSGHKIHGPKGVGFLYINEKAKIQPQILGGGQQGGMRSGTDNVPGIAGLGAAAVEIYKNLEEVSQPALFLQEQGFEVTYLPVDSRGVVKMDALKAVLREDTILVSVMYVNNEVGAVMPVEEIAALVHEKSPKALFHVDAIQAFGKYRIYPKKMGIDLLSVSGHKIHGPKGVGFLYINEKAKIQPQILGGGQQGGMRSGTDNVPGIAGLGAAAVEIYKNLEENVENMYRLKEHIAQGLEKIGDIRINGMDLREGAPQILSISVMGVRSEVLLHSLEERGIYVSAGSACSSHKRKPSATLAAMGMSKDQIESTVRLSFCEENTIEEADYFLQVMGELVPMLRRYSRR